MTLYRETPCETCGNKPWQSVYAFRSPGIAHLLPSDDLKKLGDPCPGSGGSREEVTIDYEAAAKVVSMYVHGYELPPDGMRLLEKQLHVGIDAALGEIG